MLVHFRLFKSFSRNSSVAKQSVMYNYRIHSLRFRYWQRNILFNNAISCENYTVSVVKEWNMDLRNLSKYNDREILSRITRKTCPASLSHFFRRNSYRSRRIERNCSKHFIREVSFQISAWILVVHFSLSTSIHKLYLKTT